MANINTQNRLDSFQENMETTIGVSLVPLMIIYYAFVPTTEAEDSSKIIPVSTWTKILTAVATPLLLAITPLTLGIGLLAGLIQLALLPAQLAYATYKDSQIAEEPRFDGYEIGGKDTVSIKEHSSSKSLSRLSQSRVSQSQLSQESPKHFPPLSIHLRPDSAHTEPDSANEISPKKG